MKKSIKKGKVFALKPGVKIKIVELAEGFTEGHNGRYWVRIMEGEYKGLHRGEETLLGVKTIRKYLK